VKTALGYLEIDIRRLLFLTAHLVSPSEVTEITENVLDMAVRVVKRLPYYLMNDLLGSRCEELIRPHFEFEIYRRQPNDGLKENKEKAIRLLEILLSGVGPFLLEIDAFRHEFNKLFSPDGYIGEKAWTSFIKSKVRVKRRKGRPRKPEYDLIFQARSGITPESYGKLLRRLTDLDAVNHADALNRAKAAVSYRKRKNI
jgi:hypothetical protein